MAALSEKVIRVLKDMEPELGRHWFIHAKKARAADDLLRIPIADGVMTTKIDGWMHAFTVTQLSLVKYAEDPKAGIDLTEVTSWTGGNSALRFGRYQADFHWNIDTRMWQYFLYLVFFKQAYRTVVDASPELTPDEKQQVLRLVEDFFDEVTVAYLYRTEWIERTRGFAPHPDESAGMGDHGYTYEKIWHPGKYDFAELPLDFLSKKVRPEAVPPDQQRTPPPFPASDAWPLTGDEWLAARAWRDRARERGLVDEYLAVRLGDRWVPTRLDGWVASLKETMRFLAPDLDHGSAMIEGPSRLGELDLTDYAVRLGLCQAMFQIGLDGNEEQLVALLDTQRAGLEQLIPSASPERIRDFVQRACRAVHAVFAGDVEVDEEVLPEIQVVRPTHPRYAPFDPLEPLPWQERDPARYLSKMAKMGYIL